MPLSEASILSNFLLPPASLPAIISLRQFTELFPRAYHSNPHIKVLYQELQHQRAIDVDDVKRNIAAEVKRGEKQRRQISRTRQKSDQEDMAGLGGQDIKMEVELFGQSANSPKHGAHTLHSVQRDMGQACADIEAEIAAMEAEAESLLAEITTAVGDLSDLRYGRFTRDDIGEDVIGAIKRLNSVCETEKGS
ncbi:hypothetical protein K432DRAFT_190928 [Lepidopterella palustris CBS 459.81]|uniref:Cnl2/NKP2 family protein n=1 Tax=Lepidopterella palustris CBS 459.81 TaxID=1314670 RepID=A0A8E2EFW9_9PEZI|nr:hypothetical protein K432DRAFT_190928 [Lepidopterella palustris CBS 459.81]